jgi:hypothetical protein
VRLTLFLFLAFAAAGQVAPTNPPATGQSPNAAASQPDPNTAQKPPEKGQITGQVVNEVTGEPLKKAAIQAYALEGQTHESISTTTDASGKYHIDELEPGKYNLTASRNGFVRRSYGAKTSNGNGTVLTVGPGGTVEAAFKLTPQSVVTGRVVDEDDEPVASVRVSLSRYYWQNGKRTLMPGGGANTNDLGEFRIFGVGPGRYFLSALYNPNQFSQGRTTADTPDSDYPTVYYPGVTDLQSAAKIEVPKSGQLNGIDMKLQKARSYRVRGKVVSSVPGVSKTSMMVVLTPKSSDQSNMWESNRMTQTDAEGKFEFHGVLPGTYLVAGNAFGGDGSARARQEISVTQEHVNGVVLNLTPGWEMAGNVRVTGDQTSSDKTGTSVSQVHLMLETDEPWSMIGSIPNATPKDDGSFTFKDVGPDRYRLGSWNLPDGYYIKSARAGATDLLDRPADMSALQGASIEVVLSAKGAIAEGNVKNDKDELVTNGTVVLVPEAARRGNHALFKRGSIDQYGHYKLTGITPGAYTIYAFQDVESGIWEDPDYLRTIEKLAVSVTLEEGGRESNDLKVIVGGE